MSVTERVLRFISPSPEEVKKVNSAASALLRRIERECTTLGIKAEPVLVGSVSKGTYIDPDIDIFIAFDRSYPLREVISTGLKIGHRILYAGKERYAEHPYVSGQFEGFRVDIVPCYRIEQGERIITAVDRSPLHTKFVNEHLSEGKRDEVRLLRAFMKSAGIYGSQVAVKGFSGYVCELLVIRFGSFQGVLEFFSSSKGKISLDIHGYSKRAFKDPFVIVDPVDQERNAGAAVSTENLAKMRVLSREYLKNPQESYFVWGLERKQQRMRRDTELTLFKIPKPQIVDDIVFPQAEKFASALWNILDQGGFQPLNFVISVGEFVEVLVEHRFSKTPRFSVHQGPPADSERTCDFIEKYIKVRGHVGPYVVGDRIYFDVPEEPKIIEDFVRERIRSYNIGKNLEEMKEKLTVESLKHVRYAGDTLRKFYSRNILPDKDWKFSRQRRPPEEPDDRPS